ncbi:MAG TPA: alpha/beta hydrolase [Propionibacteriaceae bacterium]
MTSSLNFVLVPGFWLGGWAWDAVAQHLTAAGHRVTAVTLPGLEPDSERRAEIGWSEQVAALRDTVAKAGSGVVLVAHSGAGSVASGVLDAEPDLVSRVVYVDSGPASDGSVYDAEASPDVIEVPLPPFDELAAGGASLDGISDEALAEFRRRAVPQPGHVTTDRVVLDDLRRRDVPTTLIACSFPAAMVQQLAAEGHPMFAEVAELSDLNYLELSTGHWPMFSRPEELAGLLVEAATGV